MATFESLCNKLAFLHWLCDKAMVLGVSWFFGSPTPLPPQDIPLAQVQASMPAGFTIEVFAAELEDPRSMALGSDGTLYVGTRIAGKVYALRHDGKRSTDRSTILEGLAMPNGVAVRDGALYVAEMRSIWRYPDIASQRAGAPRRELVHDGFPGQFMHGWKFIRFGPDGLLYVPNGSRADDALPAGNEATLGRIRADGRYEVIARGIRNTVGFDWNPATHELWFTENGRDHWCDASPGPQCDDQPADELNHAPRVGLDFGFPYCHAGDLADPKFGNQRQCSEFAATDFKLQPHAAALGMRFYTGSMVPPEWRDGFFFAEHGSWNRKDNDNAFTGFAVRFARMENGRVVEVKPLAEGFHAKGAKKPRGRPVDVEVMPDGALLVSDDYAGAIYRISYRAP